MALFESRTPEDRVADAAFRESWAVIGPVEGMVKLSQPSLDAAWQRAWVTATKAGKKLPEDLVRLQAQKGFAAAVQQWDARVADLFATKRRVITEAAYTFAAPAFSALATAEDVNAATETTFAHAAEQVRWHNDGTYAVTEDAYVVAVRAGVQQAASERIGRIAASGAASSTGGPIPMHDAAGRAREMARDAARYAAVAALSASAGTDVGAGETVAYDAAAAAVSALPDEVVEALTDEAKAEAVATGAEEALRETVARPGAEAGGMPGSETAAAAPPPGAPAGAYAGPPPGFFNATVGPAAGRAAANAKVTQQRLAIAASVKKAVDTKLPEATGYGLSRPESDRAYAAGRSAAAAANERAGTPFTAAEAERIGDMTTAGIIATWYAIGHLQRSGAAEAVGGMARDSAKRLLASTKLPPTLIDYLVDEAVRVATPEWGQGGPTGAAGAGGGSGGGATGGSDRWADRARAARGRTTRYTYRGREVPDYYDLLQVSTKASPDVIEKAWRVLIAQSHPDTGGDPVRAQQLNEAREVLLNPVARAAYDQENGF